jgi:2-polyprenyl-3-methyl-5-hydroxy-6-metoxy-1,4-benzoquinol methylase
MSVRPKQFLHEVKNQYEMLPYPFRDPEKELETLHANDAISLNGLNHYGWAGKRDFREGVRVLIAGQGTGDCTVFFAEQLREMPKAEIVALDLSEMSISISKARLAKRRLDNVTHINASIMDLPALGLGTFDVIECGGVLHHLADPDAGLRSLAAMLSPDGIMAIMVYGQHGRMAVYMLQELMRNITTPDMDADEKIALCKTFLQAIPKGHWLMYNNEFLRSEVTNDAGIYDLFLHPQDRAYTVPQIYTWLEQAKLSLVSFYGRRNSDILYDPAQYTKSEPLKARFANKSLPERHAIAELMHGHMTNHFFYASLTPKTPAELSDDMVPTLSFQRWADPAMLERIATALDHQPGGGVYEELYKGQDASETLRITRHPLSSAILRLMDSQRSVKEIFNACVKNGSVSAKQRVNFDHDMKAVFNDLHARQAAYLRHKSIAPYSTMADVIRRVEALRCQ